MDRMLEKRINNKIEMTRNTVWIQEGQEHTRPIMVIRQEAKTDKTE